ncbi:MAG: sugar ABC transporter permease [Butyrivibrio sp.]|uniref:ABC transporter permease n=1 Tax=Butyrivibrio sp. TaxID=28121 RepID=UPI001B1E452A|nr:ABC transporter permease subunit [Butyrivibrio sp.]MBO6242691.1 sugar ABC transporter permease [Butyrivibrio sp.]
MRSKKTKLKRFIPLYMMMVPGLAYLLINNYIPMLGIVIAFKQVNFRKGIIASPWVGLSNFKFLFKGDAWIITRNTLGYNILFIFLTPIIAITVAILLNELRSAMSKKFYQTVILIPYLISIVVTSYLVYAFLATDNGYFNNTILPLFGLEAKSWYSSPQYWPFILVLVHIWKGFGYSTIIYYATLVGIDSGYYEAAAIDGANRWKRIVHVTLPALKPTIITLTLLSIGRIFYSDFGLFYQVPMSSGPLLDVTNTIDTYVYRALMQSNNIGMSSAAGVYQSIIGFILVLGANILTRKISAEDALF